ncbi:hypothetical protein [Mesorhizobium sp.]|uniref:hypothetical protein n=1 Tax=Mesorhizobium sp. TaxID=1871066 RepID=UPI000FE5F4B6|nr:hypothetical protein [Mesorhizobium sp.]RWQ64138.1 MAG: hypothetical protein EOS86_21270 [Mesorhizobium sp.]
MTLPDSILGFIGLLTAYGAGVAGGIYGFFKLFGEQWMAARFSRQLEAFKGEQEREMEHLRYRISRLFDRATKLHQSEFEAVPELWKLLVIAHNFVVVLVSPIQSYPDVQRMNAAHLDEFLAESPLLKWQKEEVRRADEKNKVYQSHIFWHRYNQTNEALREFSLYSATKGIFLQPELHAKFDEIEGLMRRALVEGQNHEHELRVRDAQTKLDTRGKELLDQIKADVRERIWSTGETA